MYDFYFGSKEEIDKDPKTYLLNIKRMLPRWCNSIPDSEYLALYNLLSEVNFSKKPVLAETGSGASTIVLCYFALKHDGELFTWDTNGSKLFYLRAVLNDTLMNHFRDKNLNQHWKSIAFSSTSPFAGIRMLKEMNKKVSAMFLDSEHTLDTLMKEMQELSEIFSDSTLVAIDDGNYNCRFQNYAYINMIRKKQGLPPVQDSKDNIGKCFWEEIEFFLKSKFRKVEHLEDTYKTDYSTDLFWSYFKAHRNLAQELKMEKTDDLAHRFDAWRVER